MINRKKWFSPLFVVFLAVAGIFSVSSYVSNKQVEGTPAVETKAASPTTLDGVVTIQIDSSDNWGKDSAKTWAWFSNDSSGCWATSYVNNPDHRFYQSGNVSRYYTIPSDTSKIWTRLTLVRTRSDWVSPGWSGDGFWGQSNDINFSSSFNSYFFTGSYSYGKADFTGQVVEFTCFSVNHPYYLEFNNNDWKQSDRNVYAHFYDPIDSSGGYEDVLLTPIKSKYADGSSTEDKYGIHECHPSTSYWRVIFYRSTSPGGTYDTQTGNLFANSNNVFKLTAMSGTGTWDWNFDEAGRLEVFGRYITDQTSGTGLCDGNTSSGDHSTAISAKWSIIKEQYDGMAPTVQNTFKSATSGGTYLTGGIARYDYIAYKYQSGCATPLSNFASRSIPKKSAIGIFSPFTISINEQSTDFTTIIIIVASSVSLLSITALSVLVIKKRKTKEE